VLARAATSFRLRAADLRDRVSGRGAARVPPRRLEHVGHSDFVATGDEFARHFVTLGGLRPSDRVLDVGCGIGRMARPLTTLLGPDGTYDGFDIDAGGVAWCREHYAAHPRFRFQAVDVANPRYNPGGALPAHAFRFPYDDGSFDFVLLTSVFTHLLPGDVNHYLGEIARVLVPGGRLFATFFLLDDEARELVTCGRSSLPFRLDARGDGLPPGDEDHAVVDPDVLEEAVAFDGAWVGAALDRHGLRETGRHPGSWSGRTTFTSYQDIVCAERPH
jgi:SAM-dependent methyltransferase